MTQEEFLVRPNPDHPRLSPPVAGTGQSGARVETRVVDEENPEHARRGGRKTPEPTR